jgi:diguanylate cyclase (GGDEF)-like protein
MDCDAFHPALIGNRANAYFRSYLDQRALSMDRVMCWLLALEWVAMVIVSLVVSPRVWTAEQNRLHPHVWAALLAGPCFILPAITIAILNPACQLTRHVIATAQIVVSILLIDCTEGRIETHFHIFGSLAILACYMDWRVLVTASLVTTIDHIFRGIWWPQSVYGVLTVSPWRWVEHLWWVIFEDSFLILATRNSLRDMRAVAVSKAQLYLGASYDVLTGLANRRLLRENFDSWLSSSSPAPRKAALLFIDLDRFKQANDTLGHTVGDRLLALVAARLQQAVGSAGTLARVGGDEFVVLLENVSEIEEAIYIGHRLAHSFSSPFRVDGHELLLSASIGTSLFPDHGTTLSDLQECADCAMYVAKSQGRNRSIVFSSEISRREGIVHEVSRDIASALSRGQFQLHFQPLLRGDKNIAGFEALLRWNHPVHGMIAPADFIPLLERSALISAVGDWALREACRTCRKWQKPGCRPVGVAVNVSSLQFEQPDYPERVFSALQETGLDPSLLTLELTESLLIRSVDRACSHLMRIRAAGVRIALDDFGTGYSSLSYLTQLPVDFIKLDHSFIGREMDNAGHVVESIVLLAHRLGMQVVAEGVETASQLKRLRDLSCDHFQGYYFSEPVPAGEIPRLLEESRPKPGLVTTAA